MWKSVIHEIPDEQDEQDNTNPLYEKWVDELEGEPWFVALRDVAEPAGTWVGTEDELVEEVRRRVHRAVRESEDFPSDYKMLDRYFLILWQSRPRIGYVILDHRELTKEDLEEFDVEGWGPAAPILLERGDAGRRPRMRDACCKLLRYESPLALAVMIFTDNHPFTKKNREWCGGSKELADKLRRSYPDDFGLRWCLEGIDPSKLAPDFLETLHKHEDKELLYGISTDYRLLYRRMKTCARIAREVGIEVSWKMVPSHRPGTNGKSERLWWTIRAPRWI
jgi:hypothetical protein